MRGMVRRLASQWQALAAVLAVWGNAAAYLVGSALPSTALGAALGLALVVIVLLWARGEGLTRGELGLAARGQAKGALAGASLALVAVAGALVVLRYPPLIGEPVSYAPLRSTTDGALVLRALVTMPLDTVVPEELAFRGVLLAALLRRYAPVGAVAIQALAFAAWHVVIVGATVAQTNLSVADLFGALGTAGALLAVAGGGALFGALRVATGGLAAPIAAHWTFNTALLIGLRALE